MAYKTYVLSDSMNISIPLFQRISKDQRVAVKKRETYSPFLQITAYDKSGAAVVLRYKETSDTPIMEEQIEKKKLPANMKFTNSERQDRNFRRGVLVTKKVNLQNYLDVYPGNENSPYTADEIPHQFKEYKKDEIERIKNTEMRKVAKAVTKVFDEYSLEKAQEVLLLIYGSFYQVPTDLIECQNILIEFIDDADEKGLDLILKDEVNIDDQTKVMIGKLLNKGLISFDAVDGKISKKDKNGNWMTIRDMASTYSAEEKQRLFSDFLNTADGKALKNDLEKDLEEAAPKAKAKAKSPAA